MSWVGASPTMFGGGGGGGGIQQQIVSHHVMPVDVIVEMEDEEEEEEEQDRGEIEDDVHVGYDGEELEGSLLLYEEDVEVEEQLLSEEAAAGAVFEGRRVIDTAVVIPELSDAQDPVARTSFDTGDVPAAAAAKEKFGHNVLITKGKYANHLARLDRRCHQSTRYSLTLLSDAAEELGLKSPKLTAASFASLPLCDPSELPATLQEFRARLLSPMSPSSRSKVTLQSKVKKKPLDGEDSTNNLYWVARSSMAKGYPHGYVCLWYGGSDITSTSVIKVIPVCREGTTSSSSSNSDFTAVDHCPLPAMSKASFIEAGDNSNSDREDPLQCLPAMRCQLQPLDSEVLEQQLQPSVGTHFIAALLDFSEWDDYNRDTYLWPQSIFDLLLDKVALQRFFHKAEHHVLRLTDRPLVDVFLFLLLAERLGCIECFDDYVDKYVLYGQCTLEVAQLFDIIKSIRDDITSSTRRSCRVGADYQADVETYVVLLPSQRMHHNDKGKSPLDYPTSPVELVVDTTRPNDSSSPNSSYRDDAVDSYLGAVQLLRERYVRTDQLVEAPNIDIDLFRSRFTAYCEATGASPLFNNDDDSNGNGNDSDDSSPLLRYRRLKTLEEFIASSRRKGYALTALSTVKRVVVHTSSCAANGELLSSSSSAAHMSQRLDFRDPSRAADASDAAAVTSAASGMVDEGEESCSFNEALAVDDCRPVHQSNLSGGHTRGSSLAFKADPPVGSNMYEYCGAHDGGGVGEGGSYGLEGVNDHAESYAAHDYMETHEVDDRAHEHGGVDDRTRTDEYGEDDEYRDIHNEGATTQFSQTTRPHLSIYASEVIEILDDDDDDSSVLSPVVIDLTDSRSVEEEEECAPLMGASNTPLVHTEEPVPTEEHVIPIHNHSPGAIAAATSMLLELEQRNGRGGGGALPAGGDSGDGDCILPGDEVKLSVSATSCRYDGSEQHVKSLLLGADHSSSATTTAFELLSHRSCLITADHSTHSQPHSYSNSATILGQEREGEEKEEALNRDHRPEHSHIVQPTHRPTYVHRRGVESVVVYRGVDELEVPIELCRIFTVPDDLALDVFFSCGGQVDNALRIIEEKLRGDTHAHDDMRGRGATTKKALMKEMRELHLTLIRPAELDILHRVVNKYHNDMRKVFLKYSLLVKTVIADQEQQLQVMDQHHHQHHQHHHHPVEREDDPYFYPLDLKATSIPLPISNSSNNSSSSSSSMPFFFSQNSVDSSSSLGIASPDTPSPAKKTERRALSCGEGGGNGPSVLLLRDEDSQTTKETSSVRYLRRTVKDICDMFFVFYPGLDEGEIPLQTAFNSGLFQQYHHYHSYRMRLDNSQRSTTTTSIAHKVKENRQAPPPRKRTFDGGTKGNHIMRNPLIPCSWPGDLPLVDHAMYLIRNSKDICLCFGIKTVQSRWEALMNVLVISADAYHRETIVSSSKLEPLTEDMIRQSNDDKVGNFAGALMDFAHWELSSLPPLSFLRRWYVYPDFVVRMLRHGPSWATWRKQAERNKRGLNISRRLVYFNSLKDDFDKLSALAKEQRYAVCSFPWEDFPFSSEGTGASDGDHYPQGGAGGGGGGGGEREGAGKVKREGVGRKRKASAAASSALVDRNSDIESFSGGDSPDGGGGGGGGLNGRLSKRQSGHPTSRKSNSSTDGAISADYPTVGRGDSSSSSSSSNNDGPGSLGSYYNLFWLPNSNLPCLYYDVPENRHSKAYMVKPFHCSTYYYPFDISSKTNIEPFSVEHLKHLSCDRTVDFTRALIRFAQAIIARYPSDEDLSSSSSNNNNSCQYFDWPFFILNMVNEPQQWKNWRCKAERISRGVFSRSDQYYHALLDDFDRLALLEDSEQPSISTSTSTSLVAPMALNVDSYLNLFWLPRSELPCIYYDTKDNRSKKEIMVLPICCSTYHYPTKVSGTAVTALSKQLLRGCREDRTHEFTEALIDFALTQLTKKSQHLYFDVPSFDDIAVGESLFDWPPFILKLINSPKEWYVWRKKAERAGGDSSRKRLYYRALCEEHEAIIGSIIIDASS